MTSVLPPKFRDKSLHFVSTDRDQRTGFQDELENQFTFKEQKYGIISILLSF